MEHHNNGLPAYIIEDKSSVGRFPASVRKIRCLSPGGGHSGHLVWEFRR